MAMISEDVGGKTKVVDVRALSPPQRHSVILEVFDKLPAGWRLLVINDHEPFFMPVA